MSIPRRLALARERLARFGPRCVLVHGSYARLDEHLGALGIDTVSAVLLDLGLSSLQVDSAGRGFSYRVEGPLDMRMDPESGPSAAEFLSAADENEISRVLREYGEEPQARRIARAITERRRRAPLHTTADLADVVQRTVSGRKPVSTLARVFQGVRVAVNRELENLREGLRRALGVLAPGSVFAVLSYHSLEDHSDFLDMREVNEMVAEGCDPIKNKDGTIKGWKKNIYSYPPIGSPGSGAYVTAGDLDRFLRAVQSGKLLSQELTKALFEPHVDYKEKEAGSKWCYEIWGSNGRFLKAGESE